MEHFFHLVWDFLHHLISGKDGDFDYIIQLIAQNNTIFYGVFFLIIFVETGLVIWPILPGDSLLFVGGAAIAATGALNLEVFIPLLIIAALLGDNVNYLVGYFLGHEIKKRKRILFFKQEYVAETEAYYAKHGGKTVIMARFIPIVRTIAPFVAGAGSMKYSRYILFCIIGAVLWVGGVTALGYYFGTIPIIKHNFEKVLVGIIVLSVLPILWQFYKSRTAAKQS